MGNASVMLHESKEDLSAPTIDRHRAMASLLEEIEAIDWYDQRAEATGDADLRAILIHNRNEEIEHASMVLEWLRRNHQELDVQLRKYLFQPGSIVREEEAAKGASGSEDSSLGIGSLRKAGGE